MLRRKEKAVLMGVSNRFIQNTAMYFITAMTYAQMQTSVMHDSHEY